MLLNVGRIRARRTEPENPVLVGHNRLEGELVTNLTALLQRVSLSTRGSRIHAKVLKFRDLIRIASDTKGREDLIRETSSRLHGSREARCVALNNAPACEFLDFALPNALGFAELVGSLEIRVSLHGSVNLWRNHKNIVT